MTERALVTYREAGVDIDAGEELVERIKPVFARAPVLITQHRPNMLIGTHGNQNTRPSGVPFYAQAARP